MKGDPIPQIAKADKAYIESQYRNSLELGKNVLKFDYEGKTFADTFAIRNKTCE